MDIFGVLDPHKNLRGSETLHQWLKPEPTGSIKLKIGGESKKFTVPIQNFLVDVFGSTLTLRNLQLRSDARI